MLIGDILDFGARRRPDAVALRFRDDAWTYPQLHQRVRRLSQALTTIARPGERIAILAQNCPEYLECCYGVPTAGMTLVFVNFRLSPAEIAYVLRDSGASIVVTEPDYLDIVERLRLDLPGIREIVLIGPAAPATLNYADLLNAVDTNPAGGVEAPARPDESDLAWLMYTSGTTGFPKGAKLTHRAVTTAVLNSALDFDHRADEVCIYHSPLCHVATYYLLLWHLRGFDVTLLRGFDADEWCRAVERYRVTYTLAVPTVLVMLLNHPGIDDYDLSSLTGILYGGAPMPAHLLHQAFTRWPEVGFHTAFGMTELAGNATYLGPAEHRAAVREAPGRLRSIGRPLPLCAIRVVDNRMNDVPDGVPGELVVRGEQVTAGYWGNEQATEAAFAGGWFHTGDLARRDADGLLYIVGRKKDMIITGGENVYPAELEDVLYRHPGVVEASVIGVPDHTWGEQIVAVVRRRSAETVGTAPTGPELIEFCRQRLASYKKPRHVLFVDELPKNAAGKILKSELRRRIADGELILAEHPPSRVLDQSRAPDEPGTP